MTTDPQTINEMIRKSGGKTTAFLVGIHSADIQPHDAKEHLDELRELVGTLGIGDAGNMLVNLRQPNPKFYIGSGKVVEIKEAAQSAGANIIVFDCELGPSQQRNIEKVTGMKAFDRQEVIIDIFARRAWTREAVLQVELARHRYYLPRLTGAWSHLSRQRGGALGTRGEGEKQIEYDRRMVKSKISALESELKEVRKQRDVQRKERVRNEIPLGAIVGYTNAGKSSLLNSLTGADALVEDKLFATLDPTTRRLELPDRQEILLTDTVGFVRKLPHSLVEAFKSTLEEAALADFLILVLDISSPHVENQWETTLAVLAELNAQDKEMLVVFNKCDVQKDPVVLARLRSLAPGGVFISCRTGEGLDNLRNMLSRYTGSQHSILELSLPPSRQDLIAMVHAKGRILESEYLEDGTFDAVASMPSSCRKNLADYIKAPASAGTRKKSRS